MYSEIKRGACILTTKWVTVALPLEETALLVLPTEVSLTVYMRGKA